MAAKTQNPKTRSAAFKPGQTVRLTEQAWIAYIVIIGGLILIAMLIVWGMVAGKDILVDKIATALFSFITLVLGFYFGSKR